VLEKAEYKGSSVRDIRQANCHRKDMIYTANVERKLDTVQLLTALKMAGEIARFGKYRVDDFLRRDLQWLVPCSHKG
jgi:hypothetical protein